MNLKHTGNFIAAKRKEKGLTQQNLAELLFISEKTVSKWECGKGFPDTSLILPLCSTLEISANELLSGKTLDEEQYKISAEKNLIELKDKQIKTDKFLLFAEWIIGYLATFILLALVCVASYCDLSTPIRAVLIAIGFINAIVGFSVCLSIEKNAGFYQCSHCKHKYIPTYKSVLWAMHRGRTRYLKCPKCGKRTWNKKVIDKD
ncbi:MAG: helix-turn-helix transcriptional regulator [Clostridia bacterium]|nr:helix-turn-helix transcriptional regulator [Clostridia bacterium]